MSEQLMLLNVPVERHELAVNAFTLLLEDKHADGMRPGERLVLTVDVEVVSSRIDANGGLRHQARVVEDGVQIR